MKNWLLVTTITCSLLLGCSGPSSEVQQLGSLDASNQAAPEVSFTDDVRPVLESRCISCHACYDAPCQLKLTAYDGVTRGATKDKVYQHKSLREGRLTRLFFDAESTLEWRTKGFHSVLSEPLETDQEAATQASILTGMIDLKTAHDLSDGSHQPDSDLPIDDASSWQCASNRAEFLDYAEDYPQRGMPYGLPGLTEAERGLIKSWVANGAADDSDYTLSEREQREVARWETWFNGESLKQRLVSRYIYEHLFLADLYFGESGIGRYFELVRSTTAPGESVDVIATRRPFDDPGQDRVFYRLRLNKETPVAKTHMPYPLDERKMRLWNEWFLGDDYSVEELPGYAIKTASNPFITFKDLPAEARYRFMLEEANFTVRGFIKGPVCKGQAAVNVINEHFWVAFVDPEIQAGDAMQHYLADVQSQLDLPAEKEDTLRLLTSWEEFAGKEKEFLKQRRTYIQAHMTDDGVLDSQKIWDGDGDNPNAALTIFRHFDHASVHQGFNGQAPKTAWVIDYPLLERIHYLLVAGYDVYGNVSHQMLSRIYMDFLRMEGESLFLLMLPEEARQDTLSYWYRGADDRISEFMTLTFPSLNAEPKTFLGKSRDDAERPNEKPKLAAYQSIKSRLGKALSHQYDIDKTDVEQDKRLLDNVKKLHSISSRSFQFLPEVSFVEVTASDRVQYFTLIKNRGLKNNTSILLEKLNAVPEETSVSVVPGFIGSRPNSFLRLPIDEIDTFTESMLTIQDDEAYQVFVNQYVVRRGDPQFWQHYDTFQQGFKKASPIDYGLLDLNKLENR
ncbi:fatty acid cis/trans isomerase [Arenicella xantha]|uniref:Fatty acid cis/trans isomerase CTI n=1 Tax=Arenicella xantha TaxID=644221 RepID=A0A395JG08_9GAMM|nr:fatty acid cis/trans isomerase [Arenicella xantha]RBP48712.1 fatty acid cis/trans isomerase CTI [Arenicella xantha]